jgi:predicted nucleic acid-binding protein
VHKYLVDTSIWVEFFRGRSPAIKERVFDLLSTNRIIMNGVVVAELLMGARGKKEVAFVREKLSTLDYLETDKDFFSMCGTLGYKIRNAGLHLPLSDIMIAAHAKMNNLTIFTKDKHFENIGRIIEVQYEIIENF